MAEQTKEKVSAKRVIWVFIGVFFIGFGSALLRLSGMGTDPFGCMNLGVSGVLHMQFGTYQLLLNIVLLIPMLIWMRKGLGLGTIVNMIGVGYVSDFCVWCIGRFGITTEGLSGKLPMQLGVMVLAVISLCFGVALYMECALGIAPYDALGEIIPLLTRERIKFFAARVITDIICVLIGFISGSVVGIATVVTAFFTGPLVSFFRKHAAGVILKEKS